MVVGRENCVILGGGGHAKVLIDALGTGMGIRPFAVLDQDRSLWGHELLGVPIIGGDEKLGEVARAGAGRFAVGLGAVGDNRPRQRLFQLGLDHGLEPLSVVGGRVCCSPSAEIGPGAQLLAGSIVNPGTIVGANVIVNSGAIIEHDCVLEDHCHVATGSRLAGSVRVGAGAHVGVGATVRQSITIGARAIVGAGAVVVRDVADCKVVVGVPARVLRDV